MDPHTSRWQSADPAGFDLANPESGNGSIIESVNWYVYCGNNPINYVDPTGLMDKSDDGYVLFNDLDDTLADAWEHAGYDSLEDAISANGLDDFYDSDGNWQYGDVLSEGEAFYGKVLKPTEERRDEYMKENYPKILEAENYAEQSKNVEVDNSSINNIIETVSTEGIGWIIGKIAPKLSTPWSVITSTTPLGSNGDARMKKDSDANASILQNLQALEFFCPKGFGNSYGGRQKAYSNTENSISFPNKPYHNW